MMTAPHADQKIINLIINNYNYLRRQYRLGGFEAEAKYVNTLSIPGAPQQFYELQVEGDEPTLGVSFKEAVDNLYQLIIYVRDNRKIIANEQKILLLRVKCLVYESEDYTLSVPPALGEEFIGWADKLISTSSLDEVRVEAEKLNGKPFGHKDAGTRVVKDLLLAAAFGANYLYRRHEAAAYDKTLIILRKINHYIDEYLPAQHEEPRDSFGLAGLAQYLTGRSLSAQGSFAEARQSFRRSAEAYVSRVRQKEDFLRRGKISAVEFQEKASVTLRRAALVSAFGDGYLSFVTSRVAMALEALTLARAVLTQNSGHFNLVYVDLLYWACKRAAHSSDPLIMRKVVRELRRCRKTLRALVPETHYIHRAGLELALALYYRAKFAAKDNDGHGAARGFRSGIRLVNDAIRYAEATYAGSYQNPHLLADALVLRSHFLRLRHRLDGGHPGPTLDSLARAEEDAERALSVGRGIAQMECEAVAALGAVRTDLAGFYKGGDEEKFQQHYDKAHALLHDALLRNNGENMRLEGTCYLRLVKLSLLLPPPQVFAHSYFKEWGKIKDRVEHAFCHDTARELRKQLLEEGPFLIIKPKESLNYKLWQGRLFNFLIDVTLSKLIAEHGGKNLRTDEWRPLIVSALKTEMGYSQSAAFDLIKRDKLITRLKQLKR